MAVAGMVAFCLCGIGFAGTTLPETTAVEVLVAAGPTQSHAKIAVWVGSVT